MKVTVIRIGKLGLGFALLLEEKGHEVCGMGINQVKKEFGNIFEYRLV